MIKSMEKLNSFQKEAVLDNSPALILNAQVGSGKTTVLISKVMYLYVEKNIPLEDMVVLTFTNKAANEIKDRVKAVNPEMKDKDMPYFGTFHSVASKLLAQSLPLEDIGYKRDFTIIDPDELQEMANRLIIEKRFSIKFVRKLPQRIEAIKKGNKLYGNMKREDDIEALWKCMIDEKLQQNKMDFDDLMIYATKLLPKATKKPKWIIVDEFQDCDTSQLDFIKAMCGTDTKLFIVGDPNQIIYSWRGSNMHVFQTLKQDYNAKEMSLPINYRSSSTIIDAAKQFLSNSSALKGVRNQGNKIVVKNHYNPFNEAQYLCDQITNLHREGISYKDIAIFYRTQRQSKTLADALVKAGIPMEVSVKQTLKDIPVLDWFVSLLKASVNNKDKNSIVATLKNKQFGEGHSFAKIRSLLKKESGQVSILLDKILGFDSWASGASIDMLEEIYGYFEFDHYLSPTTSSYLENKTYILDFINEIKEYIKAKELGLVDGLTEFLHSSTLYGLNILKDSVHLDDESVKLMTLHACKGLEFSHVFIVGVNDGLIPLRTKSTDEYEEEKRLFFVGITRAKDNLEISYYTKPDNPWVFDGPSNFVTILPQHLIEQEEKSGQEVNLQAIRKEIMENKEKLTKSDLFASVISDDSSQEDESSNESRKRVRHEKYGEGTVEFEDDQSITIIFEGYGSKTFMKMFTKLEYIS